MNKYGNGIRIGVVVVEPLYRRYSEAVVDELQSSRSSQRYRTPIVVCAPPWSFQNTNVVLLAVDRMSLLYK